MKNKLYGILTVALATVSLFSTGCNDDMSGIGDSLTSSEISIIVDSIYYPLQAKTVTAPDFESRSSYNLLGSIDVPEYGRLRCSYVTQFLPAETLNLPDTITSENIDSVKLILSIPKQYISGDTLAPQQMKVFSLTSQLPSDIKPSFNPDGYYSKNDPLTVKNYTLSGYSFNDTSFINSKSIQIKSSLPLEIGKNVVEAYSSDPELFVWPQEFAKYWPGIYVTNTFGKGCIAPVERTSIFAYFPKTVTSTTTDENGLPVIDYKTAADSICLFTTAPEVLSSVNIDYQPSDNIKNLISEGKSIITTPGGYTVSIRFPAKEILKEYWDQAYDLGVINNMIFSIPASTVPNSYGLGIPPALLMIKTSEMDSFFTEGKLPDDLTSFTSIFSSTSNSYVFTSMRQYIVNLREKGEENITDDDISFTLVPVTVSTEDYQDYTTGKTVTVVTSITPYIIMPTMVNLDTENSLIVFTYSNQILE